MYVGNVLECMSPSTGIKLYGSSLYGATINLESNDLILDTSSCGIDTDSIDSNSSQSDIIWLHPNCNGDANNNDCFMYLGNESIANSGNYSLTNSELSTISTNNKGTLYIVDVFSFINI